MRFEIRRIQQSFGITSIYVTHDQAEAMTVSDRIVVMNEGHIMQVGTPFEIYSHPANRFVADFIGRVNFLESIVEEKEESGKYRVHIGKNIKLINSSTGNFSKGDKVLTVVRPESLTVSLGEKNNTSVFNGIVEKAVYLGPTVEYDIKIDGRDNISAVTHNPVVEGVFKQGDRVNIDFNPGAAHLLGL